MLPKLARAAWFIAKQWPRAGHRGCAMLDTQNGGVAGTAASVEGGGHSAQFSFRNDTERNLTLSLVCVFLLLCLSVRLSLSVSVCPVDLYLSVPICTLYHLSEACVLCSISCPVPCVLCALACVLCPESKSESESEAESELETESASALESKSESMLESESELVLV